MKLEKSKDVLVHINCFKEEGNVFYKKGEVDEALEKYGFAGFSLHALKLKRRTTKLISLRQHLCTMVLNFNSQNVKALFWRALAAIELGRHDLAFWDLSLANEVEPSNQEVEKKLNHVKNLLHNPSIELAQDTGSADLDLNPSLPRNSSVGRILKDESNRLVDCEVGARNDKKGGESPPKVKQAKVY
ncbi:Mitochondrial import receptor subunit TOM34 [Bienertia sinuspersici]